MKLDVKEKIGFHTILSKMLSFEDRPLVNKNVLTEAPHPYMHQGGGDPPSCKASGNNST